MKHRISLTTWNPVILLIAVLLSGSAMTDDRTQPLSRIQREREWKTEKLKRTSLKKRDLKAYFNQYVDKRYVLVAGVVLYCPFIECVPFQIVKPDLLMCKLVRHGGGETPEEIAMPRLPLLARDTICVENADIKVTLDRALKFMAVLQGPYTYTTVRGDERVVQRYRVLGNDAFLTFEQYKAILAAGKDVPPSVEEIFSVTQPTTGPFTP
jgi:hypothetical protein